MSNGRQINLRKSQPDRTGHRKPVRDDDDVTKDRLRHGASIKTCVNTQYVVIWRTDEMIRVYKVVPGEDLDSIYSLDRTMLDGSYLEEEDELEMICCEETTLEKVRSWIMRQQQEYQTSGNDYVGSQPGSNKPIMGRMENKIAYAVLDKELIMMTEQNAYLHRPGIQIQYEGRQPYSYGQPYSYSHCQGSIRRKWWDLSHWVVFTEIELAVEYAKLSGVSSLRKYDSDDQLCVDLYRGQNVFWEYSGPTKIVTQRDTETRGCRFGYERHNTIAGMIESDEVKLNRTVGMLQRIIERVHGSDATSVISRADRQAGGITYSYSILAEECRTLVESLFPFHYQEDRADADNDVRCDNAREGMPLLSAGEAFRRTQGLIVSRPGVKDEVERALRWIEMPPNSMATEEQQRQRTEAFQTMIDLNDTREIIRGLRNIRRYEELRGVRISDDEAWGSIRYRMNLPFGQDPVAVGLWKNRVLRRAEDCLRYVIAGDPTICCTLCNPARTPGSQETREELEQNRGRNIRIQEGRVTDLHRMLDMRVDTTMATDSEECTSSNEEMLISADNRLSRPDVSGVGCTMTSMERMTTSRDIGLEKKALHLEAVEQLAKLDKWIAEETDPALIEGKRLERETLVIQVDHLYLETEISRRTWDFPADDIARAEAERIQLVGTIAQLEVLIDIRTRLVEWITRFISSTQSLVNSTKQFKDSAKALKNHREHRLSVITDCDRMIANLSLESILEYPLPELPLLQGVQAARHHEALNKIVKGRLLKANSYMEDRVNELRYMLRSHYENVSTALEQYGTGTEVRRLACLC